MRSLARGLARLTYRGGDEGRRRDGQVPRHRHRRRGRGGGRPRRLGARPRRRRGADVRRRRGAARRPRRPEPHVGRHRSARHARRGGVAHRPPHRRHRDGPGQRPRARRRRGGQRPARRVDDRHRSAHRPGPRPRARGASSSASAGRRRRTVGSAPSTPSAAARPGSAASSSTSRATCARRFVDAAAVFAPQKGASPAQVGLLTARLSQLAQRYRDELGVDVTELVGGGAAGGLAGGLAALGGRIVPGFELVAEHVELPERIAAADVVVTGEGYLDAAEPRRQGRRRRVRARRRRRASRSSSSPATPTRTSSRDLERPGVTVVSLVARFGERRARSTSRAGASSTPRSTRCASLR